MNTLTDKQVSAYCVMA